MTLQLTGTDRNGSPGLSLSGGSWTTFAWGPFGDGAVRTGTAVSLPGFNGERQDPLSGVTHLGNGYRAYSPALRRFTCPDSASPFGIGGINPYVYCEHDPVNRTDPSGHGPITWLIRKVITLGVRLGLAAAETADSMASGLTTAGAVETGTELSTQVATGVSQQIAQARGNMVAARELGWASLGMGMAGGLGLAEGDVQQVVKELRGAAKSYGLMEGESTDLSDLFGPEGGYRSMLDEGSGMSHESGIEGAQESFTGGRNHETPLRPRSAVQRATGDDNLVNNAEFSLSDRNGSVMRSRTSHSPGNTRSFTEQMNEHGNISGAQTGSVAGESAMTEMSEHTVRGSGRSAKTHFVGGTGELSARVSGDTRYTPGRQLKSNNLNSWSRQGPSEPKFRPGASRYVYVPSK